MIDKKTLLRYVRQQRIPRGPITVHIDITNACNLNCITCWNYSPYLKEPKDSEWRGSAISLADFRHIIRDLSRIGVEKLILSGGGEPFTHPEIYKMITTAGKAGFHVTVITNGLLVDEEKLLADPDIAPKRLLVNLCAASPGVYATAHPNREPVDFDHLVEGLRTVNRFIPLSLVMVISNVNHHELNQMARLAATFENAQLSFKLASLGEETARFALSKTQKKELLETGIPLTRKICKQNKIPNNLDVFASQLSGKKLEYPIRETGCFAGIFYSRIYSTGDVFFCCAHIKVGNVFEKPFSKIWTSYAYNRIRERMQDKWFFPECKRCGKFNLNFKARQILTSEGYRK